MYIFQGNEIYVPFYMITIIMAYSSHIFKAEDGGVRHMAMLVT